MLYKIAFGANNNEVVEIFGWLLLPFITIQKTHSCCAILRLFPQIKFTKNNSLQTMMKLSKYLYIDHHTTQSTINKVLVFQGDDMLHEIYYNIGVVEVQSVTICKK